MFGKCANEPSHGHNYIITLELEHLVLTHGMVVNFSTVKKVFKEFIDEVYDHHFLNDCPTFRGVIVTAENMARIFYIILKEELPSLKKVIVQETQNAEAEYEE